MFRNLNSNVCDFLPDSFKPPQRSIDKPFRLCVSDVFKGECCAAEWLCGAARLLSVSRFLILSSLHECRVIISVIFLSINKLDNSSFPAAHCVQVPATKPDSLSPVPWSLMAEGDDQLLSFSPEHHTLELR